MEPSNEPKEFGAEIPSAVRKQGSLPEGKAPQAKRRYVYPEHVQREIDAGINPGARAEAAFRGQPYTPQPKPKPVSPLEAAKNRDMDFYSRDVGDTSAAMTIANSKGKALFQMFESFRLSTGYAENDRERKTPLFATYRIVPKGERQIPTENGITNVPLWRVAQARGVTVVPYKGGDDGAEQFRQLIDDGGVILNDLDRLEAIYARNSIILTSMGISEDSAESGMLEKKLVQSVGKFFSGTKTLGGQTSDRDMRIIEGMVPQRASNTFGRLGGNELNNLKKLRGLMYEKLKSVANANGLDLLEERPKGVSNAAVRQAEAASKDLSKR